MSNHYHLVLRIDTATLESLTDRDVATRWTQIFKGHVLVQRYLAGATMDNAERTAVSDMLQEYRARLGDISWFMRCLNEHVARKANDEDGCKGRFWEGRFKSQALLDDARRPPLSPSVLPIAALSQSLGHSRQEPTRMILADRLSDPTLRPAQTVAVAEAVERLTRELDVPANPRIRRILVGFLATHACPEPSYDAATLAVARTLLRLGARGAVTQAARGPCDRAAMKASLQAAIRGHDPHGRAPGTSNP